MRLLLLAILIAYGHAETCDMETVHQCVRSGMGTPPPMGEMKAKFEKCFTDSSCKVPQSKGTGRGQSDAVRQCRKTIMDKVKTDIEKCVQKTNANFKFPVRDDKGSQEHFGFNGGRGLGFGGGKGKGRGYNLFDQMLNQSCPNAQAQANVKTCLQAMRPAGTRPPRGAWADKQKEMCQKRVDCFAKLSTTCQKTLNDTKTAVCQCAKDILTPQATQLDTDLQACKPADGGGQQKSFRGGRTQKPFSPGQRLMDRFCKQDRCQLS